MTQLRIMEVDPKESDPVDNEETSEAEEATDGYDDWYPQPETPGGDYPDWGLVQASLFDLEPIA